MRDPHSPGASPSVAPVALTMGALVLVVTAVLLLRAIRAQPEEMVAAAPPSIASTHVTPTSSATPLAPRQVITSENPCPGVKAGALRAMPGNATTSCALTSAVLDAFVSARAQQRRGDLTLTVLVPATGRRAVVTCPDDKPTTCLVSSTEAVFIYVAG